MLNYCLNDEKNGDKQSTTVLSTICRQKAIDWEAYQITITDKQKMDGQMHRMTTLCLESLLQLKVKGKRGGS